MRLRIFESTHARGNHIAQHVTLVRSTTWESIEDLSWLSQPIRFLDLRPTTAMTCIGKAGQITAPVFAYVWHMAANLASS
jgi:hypothetical protein